MTAPETREKLSQQASKRQRDERGHFLPKPDPAVRIAKLEADRDFWHDQQAQTESLLAAARNERDVLTSKLEDSENDRRVAGAKCLDLAARCVTEAAIAWTIVVFVIIPLAVAAGHFITTQGVWK